MPIAPPTHRAPGNTGQAKPWAKRAGAPKRLAGRAGQARRRRIAVRDKFQCYLCQRITTEGQADHVVPLSQHGADDESNMRWCCIPCHRAKTARESGPNTY